MTEGNVLNQLGTYTSLGNFVPTDFYPELFAAMKWHDVLFDENVVTFIKSKNGRPLPIPTADDTSNVATLVSSEGTQYSEEDISNPNHSVIGVYSFSSPKLIVSLEAFEDMECQIINHLTWCSILSDKPTVDGSWSDQQPHQQPHRLTWPPPGSRVRAIYGPLTPSLQRRPSSFQQKW